MRKLWRRLLSRLMLATFGYEHADVNTWRDSGHLLHAETIKLRAALEKIATTYPYNVHSAVEIAKRALAAQAPGPAPGNASKGDE